MQLPTLKPDDPRIAERVAFCRTSSPDGGLCPKNFGVKDGMFVLCDCKPCQAKSLATWACPMGHFPALIEAPKPKPATTPARKTLSLLSADPNVVRAARGQNRAACGRCANADGDRCKISGQPRELHITEGDCPLPHGRGLPHLGNLTINPDRIVCLSLDSRPDRWEALNTSAKKSKHLSRWKIERYRARLPGEFVIPDWFEPKLPNRESIYATGRDHLAIIEQVYGSGVETLLILEDDAIVQDCFDEAYEAACAALPADWMGLYLTTDGHQKKPMPVAPGLVRCTDQAMLHAVLYSRRGMRRVWHHVTHNRHQIIDGATEDLHSIEPHFFATDQNAVRQFGCRYSGERNQFFDAIEVKPLRDGDIRLP